MKTFVGVFGLFYFAVMLYQLVSGNKWPPKPVWFAANILAVFLTPWEGYVSITPAKLRHTNPDAVFMRSDFADHATAFDWVRLLLNSCAKSQEASSPIVE